MSARPQASSSAPLAAKPTRQEHPSREAGTEWVKAAPPTASGSPATALVRARVSVWGSPSAKFKPEPALRVILTERLVTQLGLSPQDRFDVLFPARGFNGVLKVVKSAEGALRLRRLKSSLTLSMARPEGCVHAAKTAACEWRRDGMNAILVTLPESFVARAGDGGARR